MIKYVLGDYQLPMYEECLRECGSYKNFDSIMNVMKEKFGVVIEMKLFGKEILPLDSDPTLGDTDGDGYLDGESDEDTPEGFAKVNATEPLKCNATIISLAEERYASAVYGVREKNIFGEYVYGAVFKNDSDDPNYGGNQNWLYEQSIEFENSKDKKVS